MKKSAELRARQRRIAKEAAEGKTGSEGLVMPMKVIFVVAITVFAFRFFFDMGTGRERAAQGREDAAREVKESMAYGFSSEVQVSLDISRPEDLTRQINSAPEMSYGNGVERVFKWRFDDGSAMVAWCRPAGPPGGGLVVHRIGYE